MKIDDIYACSLKAAALGGEERVVTITGGEVRKVEDGKKKLVLSFAEYSQPLFLNVTNARKIATIHGDEATLWKGKQIVLYPTETDFGGRMVDCIRVKAVPVQEPQQPAAQAQQPGSGGAVRF